MIEDDDMTARLLRLAGRRPAAPVERVARVRQMVHERWRANTRQRRVRRRAMVAALAAVAGLILAVVLMRPAAVVAPAGVVVARIERTEGPVELQVGGRVQQGEWTQTGKEARVGLRLISGTSVRLDEESRMRLISPDVIELAAGALYLDTGRESTGLEVRTPFGTARDIGTQFEVRLRDASLQLRVRTGLVELRRGADVVPARAGTELTITAGGTATRPIPTNDPEWAWTIALAPQFDIEGRSVAAYVEHLSREQGWTLRYADASLARDATSMILHGSVAGLETEDAIATALAASGLVHRVRDGELLVERSRDRQ